MRLSPNPTHEQGSQDSLDVELAAAHFHPVEKYFNFLLDSDLNCPLSFASSVRFVLSVLALET